VPCCYVYRSHVGLYREGQRAGFFMSLVGAIILLASIAYSKAIGHHLNSTQASFRLERSLVATERPPIHASTALPSDIPYLRLVGSPSRRSLEFRRLSVTTMRRCPTPEEYGS